MLRAATFRTEIRRRLNLLTDYDRRLREKWVEQWAFGLRAGALVLDAGAGDAHMAAFFGQQRYVGVDVRPRLDDRQVVFCAGDLHALPFGTEVFDHVVSVQVLEHVRDPRVAFQEIARVLKPGGTACLSVPQADPEHEQPYDYFRFTTFSLQAMAQEAGLRLAEVRKKGGYFRRLSAELRDLPFVVLPEDRRYRFGPLALIARWGLIVLFTFIVSTALLIFDPLDRVGSYTTGYFCVLAK